jgi:uncharacterized membrane protein
MAHGSVAVPYCWDQCFVPHGTGAGLTEEGVCCWLTRLERHLEDSLPPPPGVLLRHPRRAEHHRPRMAYTYIPSRAAHDAVRCIIRVSCDDQPSAAFCVGRTTRDPKERVMIVIIGLIILVAAVVVGVAGVLSNGGSGHALTHGFAVFGYHVTGSTGALFLYGIVVGAVAILGFSLLLAGARRTSRRGDAARRGLKRSRSETAAVSKERDDLIDQREAARADRERGGEGPPPQ